MEISKSLKKSLDLVSVLPEYVQTLKANGYSQKTITKEESFVYKIADLIKDCNINLGIKEDLIKLRECVETLKKTDGQRYSITVVMWNIKACRQLLTWLQNRKGYAFIQKNKIEDLIKPTIALKTEFKTYHSQLNNPISAENFQILYDSCDDSTILGSRNKALLLLLAYSALRNSAIRSMRIESLSIDNDAIFINQNPNNMDIKYSKNITSYLILPKQQMRADLQKYVNLLKENGFEGQNPLFGKLEPVKDAFGNFNAKLSKITKEFYKSNSGLNSIIKKMCRDANLNEVYTVHSFRHFYALYLKPYLKSASEIESAVNGLGHNSLKLLLGAPYGKQTFEKNHENMVSIQRRIWSSNSKNGADVIAEISDLSEQLPKDVANAIKPILNLCVGRTSM